MNKLKKNDYVVYKHKEINNKVLEIEHINIFKIEHITINEFLYVYNKKIVIDGFSYRFRKATDMEICKAKLKGII